MPPVRVTGVDQLALSVEVCTVKVGGKLLPYPLGALKVIEATVRVAPKSNFTHCDPVAVMLAQPIQNEAGSASTAAPGRRTFPASTQSLLKAVIVIDGGGGVQGFVVVVFAGLVVVGVHPATLLA